MIPASEDYNYSGDANSSWLWKGETHEPFTDLFRVGEGALSSHAALLLLVKDLLGFPSKRARIHHRFGATSQLDQHRLLHPEFVHKCLSFLHKALSCETAPWFEGRICYWAWVVSQHLCQEHALTWMIGRNHRNMINKQLGVTGCRLHSLVQQNSSQRTLKGRQSLRARHCIGIRWPLRRCCWKNQGAIDQVLHRTRRTNLIRWPWCIAHIPENHGKPGTKATS